MQPLIANKSAKNALKVFISYAHEDREIMLNLLTHLATLVRDNEIVIWEDGKILAGDNWEEKINAKLNLADIVILLVSSHFTASGFIWDIEVPKAYERAEKGECLVVPILLRPCYYGDYISEKAMLPKNKQNNLVAISKWEDKDEAFTSVVEELRKVVAASREDKPTNKIAISTKFPESVSFTIKNVWGSLPLKKGIPKYKIMQLNRELAFGKSLKPLDDPAYNDRNLIYFITACKTQSPDNIAKRLFYFCHDVFNSYASSSDEFDDIVINELEIRRSPELTWQTCWRRILTNLPDAWIKSLISDSTSQDVNFATFIANVLEFVHPIKRFPIFFRLDENEWANTLDIGDHLKYIIDQFSSFPSNAHKFVFFFLVELDGLHNYHDSPNHPVAKKFQIIKEFSSSSKDCENSPHFSFIELLDYVTEADLKAWFNSLIDFRIVEHALDDYFALLISILLKELNQKELFVYNTHRYFNMERLVFLQRYAYNFVK